MLLCCGAEPVVCGAAHIVQSGVFVVHGGVPTTQPDLKQIAKMPIRSRFCVDSDDYDK